MNFQITISNNYKPKLTECQGLGNLQKIDHPPKKSEGEKIIEEKKIQFIDKPNKQSCWQTKKSKGTAKKVAPGFTQKRLGIARAWKTLTGNCQTKPSKNKAD